MARVSDIFDVQYGHSLELNRLKRNPPGEGVAFVSRQMGNNGISAWVGSLPDLAPAPAGELSCALGGNGVLTTHLQEQPYYTGRDVARLAPRVEMTRVQLLFYSMCIKANRYRYSYGRQANRSLKDLEVPGLDALPAYVHASDVERFAGRDAPLIAAVTPPLDTAPWRPFKLKDLFTIRKGKRLTKADMVPGTTAFISALDWNNGLRQRIGSEPRHPAGVLTVNYNGNGVAEAYYQPEPFWASDDVNVLYPRLEGMDSLVILFVCTVIRLEKYRFNYGRKWNLERMKDSVVRLPAKSDGSPDLAYMRAYIGSLRFSSQVDAAPAPVREMEAAL